MSEATAEDATAPPSPEAAAQEISALLGEEQSSRKEIEDQHQQASNVIRSIALIFHEVNNCADDDENFLFWMVALSLCGSPHAPRHYVSDFVAPLTLLKVKKAHAASPFPRSTSALLPLVPAARPALPEPVVRVLDATPAFEPLGTALPTAAASRGWSGPQTDTSTPMVAQQSSNTASAAAAASSDSAFVNRSPPQWILDAVSALRGGRSNFESAAKSAAKNGVISLPVEVEGGSPSKKLSRAEKEHLKEKEKEQRLNAFLGYTLNQISEKNFDGAAVFDTAKCRVLHSKERTPVLLTWQQHKNKQLILKTDDDLRLEAMGMMIVRWCNSVFLRENICYCSTAPKDDNDGDDGSGKSSSCSSNSKKFSAPVFAEPYDITVLESTGSATGGSGLVQFLQNANSVHEVRTKLRATITDDSKDEALFCEFLASRTENAAAFCHFMATFVGASAAQYLLALRDRHNSNILCKLNSASATAAAADAPTLTTSWLNIDYSFALGRAPGGAFSVETAPFRLPDEIFWSLLSEDGKSKKKSSPKFHHFAGVFAKSLFALREHFFELELALSAVPASVLKKLSCMSSSKDKSHPHEAILNPMRKRLLLSDKKARSQEEVLAAFSALAESAALNSGTRMYDSFQKKTNGIN